MRSRSLFTRPAPLALLAGAGALFTVATLAGCQPDRGPGDVAVSFVLGNNKTCDEVGVTDVRAAVFKGSYDDASVLYSDSIPCDVDAEIVLEDVEPDTYELRVIGYNQDQVAIFDNLGQIASERRIEVFEAAESAIEAELTARPAELYLRWRLGEGGFANCAGVGIATFEVTAYQTGGGTPLLETTFDCEATGDNLGFHDVPDPNRELNGVLFGEVGVQALDADGSEVGSPALFVFEPVGPGYSVQLTIECTEGGCSPEQP